MNEYKIIRSGKSILPFFDIPPEFEGMKLEITIRPIISKNKKDLQAILKRYKDVTPFASIADPIDWQKGMRDEW